MTDIVKRPWYHHLGRAERAEVERMADEIEQLRMQLADHGETITKLETENERLRHERHTTKQMLKDLLEQHGAQGAQGA